MARVLHWFCALVVGSVLSGFAFLLLTGQYFADGPVVAQVVQEHGLHRGDVFVIAGWGLAMVALAWLSVRTRPCSRTVAGR